MDLSQKIADYIKNSERSRKEVDKPSWTEYFIMMAQLASLRSSDAQTKHGCVITDKKNRVLGIGYNSFPSGMPDDILPNLRPEKYRWMVHAERNALSNCSLRPEGGIAYVTGPPCLDCAKAMYQEGVRHFVCLNSHGTYLMDDTEKTCFEILVKYGKITVDWIEP